MIKYTMEYVGKDGKQHTLSFDCPFVPWPYYDTKACYCWVIEPNWRGNYFVSGHRVTGIAYQSGWGIVIDGDSWWSKDLIGKDVFEYDDLDKAIQKCVKINQASKVKVRRNGL